MNYSTDVKRMALEKMLRPGAPKLSALSREMDIPEVTLYYWLRKAKNGGMNGQKKQSNLRAKMALVLEARALRDEDLGLWLREKGLHESQLDAWAKEIESILEHTEGQGGRESDFHKEIKELKREINRKDKALAEMTALVVLKKKLAAILGEEDL